MWTRLLKLSCSPLFATVSTAPPIAPTSRLRGLMLALPTLCLAIPLSPLFLVFPSTYPSSCTQRCSEEAWLCVQGICTLPSDCHKISRPLNALCLTFLWTLFARSLAEGRTSHISNLHHLFMATSVSQKVIRYPTRNLKAPFPLVDKPHSSECFSEV